MFVNVNDADETFFRMAKGGVEMRVTCLGGGRSSGSSFPSDVTHVEDVDGS